MKNAVILIPSFEPDKLLIDTVKSLYNEDFPILLVNDGSGDEYDEIFNEVLPYVTYFKQPKNKGKGAALKLGFKNLLENFPEAKYVITVDGDGQHGIKDVLKVYEALEEENELIFGVRRFNKKVPFRSRFGNDWSKVSRSLLTKQYIADDQCGLRGFPIRYLDELIKVKGNRYEYEMNQVVLFQLKQYIIYSIPIETIYLDDNSRSHFSPFLDTCRIQGRILLRSIISILCGLALIAGLIVLNYFGINSKITNTVTVYGSYSIAVFLYFSLSSIFYPSKTPKRRFLKELMFGYARASFCHLILMINIDTFNIPYFVIIPIAVISASSVNVLLAWALRGMFPTH